MSLHPTHDPQIWQPRKMQPEVLEQTRRKVDRRCKGVASFLKSISLNLIESSLEVIVKADVGAIRGLLGSVRQAHWQAKNFSDEVNADYIRLSDDLTGQLDSELDIVLRCLKNQMHEAQSFCDTFVRLERDLCNEVQTRQVANTQCVLNSCSKDEIQPPTVPSDDLADTDDAEGEEPMPDDEDGETLDSDCKEDEEKVETLEITNAGDDHSQACLAIKADVCGQRCATDASMASKVLVTAQDDLCSDCVGLQTSATATAAALTVEFVDDHVNCTSMQMASTSSEKTVSVECVTIAILEAESALGADACTPNTDTDDYKDTNVFFGESSAAACFGNSAPVERLESILTTSTCGYPQVCENKVTDVNTGKVTGEVVLADQELAARLDSLDGAPWSVLCQHLFGELLALRATSTHFRAATSSKIEAWLVMSWAGADLPSPDASPCAKAVSDRAQGFVDDTAVKDSENSVDDDQPSFEEPRSARDQVVPSTDITAPAVRENAWDHAVSSRDSFSAFREKTSDSQTTSTKKDFQVRLNVYDVSQHPSVQWLNSIFANPYSPIKFGGVFHLGVEIDNKEWSFGHKATGTGVFWTPPKANFQHHFRETVELDSSKLSSKEIATLIQEMSNEWEGRTYHVLNRNCCHFADELCQRLGAGPAPEWTHRLAGIGSRAAEAVGGLDRQASLMHFSRSVVNLQPILAGPKQAALLGQGTAGSGGL
eukprot:TRINITY_DN87596_c0_g1_i1.p1 TRINITY_DN87596_c0_g1~~TRINITY_DN87596_c0_g1_i1.p1  ORF type:complete len:713 (-),score=133.20 TRINITY_DN87596_c0_g1_i1:1030-3168(-)